MGRIIMEERHYWVYNIERRKFNDFESRLHKKIVTINGQEALTKDSRIMEIPRCYRPDESVYYCTLIIQVYPDEIENSEEVCEKILQKFTPGFYQVDYCREVDAELVEIFFDEIKDYHDHMAKDNKEIILKRDIAYEFEQALWHDDCEEEMEIEVLEDIPTIDIGEEDIIWDRLPGYMLTNIIHLPFGPMDIEDDGSF